METIKRILKSTRLGFVFLLGMIVVTYAYGFQVTKVSLSEINETQRQESFVRILRALAHPDIFEYEQEEFLVETPFYMPCPAGELEIPEPDTSQPYMIVTPPCAEANSEITVEGFNFEPGTSGPLNFIPPSGVTLQLGRIQADTSGYFEVTVELPNRQPVEEAQHIRAITRRNVGNPQFTRTAKDTWEKIIETVFLALLATTFGTVLAIPVSFFAARNLMKDVNSPIASIGFNILLWPPGVLLGYLASHYAIQAGGYLTANLWLNLAGMVIIPVIAWLIVRWAIPPADLSTPPTSARIARSLGVLVAIVLGILSLSLLAHLSMTLGELLIDPLGPFGFLATFLFNLGEILSALLTLIVSISGGAVLGSFGGRIGQLISERTSKSVLHTLNYLIAAAAGAVVFLALGAVVEWLYQIGDPLKVYILPAAVGGLIGILIAFNTRHQDAVPIGLTIYYITRLILNTLRSIEAFIMAIIFVALVSTGPFAGVLALSLHTIAALAKLYSEQVESILPGPLEAIRATGATRMQTIIYAVIPQIIPPYISFTMYRWDINVRMSTIIGFAGGGGIGFLLQQNINLLNYRAASVQMLAITVVVALMDYISSSMRERVV